MVGRLLDVAAGIELTLDSELSSTGGCLWRIAAELKYNTVRQAGAIECSVRTGYLLSNHVSMVDACRSSVLRLYGTQCMSL